MNIINTEKNLIINYTALKNYCKMESEYAIKISLTKHEHDNLQNPYYWSLLKYDTSWCQISFGWGNSPQECFSMALESYYMLERV